MMDLIKILVSALGVLIVIFFLLLLAIKFKNKCSWGSAFRETLGYFIPPIFQYSMNRLPTITTTFNVVLFLYLVFLAGAQFLLEPIPNQETPLDWVYQWNPVLAVLLGLLIMGVTIFWGSKLFQYFWNRLLTDMFKVRAITFNEAMGIFLIFSIIVVW